MAANSFADAVLAMHFSTMSSDPSSCCSYSPHHQALLDQLAYAAPPPRRSSPPGPAGRRLAPAGGGRAGKRRSRASKRAPTTYISTDPSNFRLMVQHITGAQAEPASSQLLDSAATAAFDANNTNMLMTDHRHQEAEQQPCFPTLDSWNISSMYGSVI
jgi:hypothetical protein